MFSEQFFDLLLNLGGDWKVDEVKMNFILEEVDIFVSYIGTKAECPASLELCSVCKKTFNPLFINSLLLKTILNL